MTTDLSGWVTKGYEIREVIDRGGFGAVYRAFQSVIGREVAIKMILPVYANQPEFIRRFETEAQLIARLEHPHIVPLYDYWRDPDGAYLVMRWLRGGNLRTALQQERLDIAQIASVIEQIAGALTIAHRNGVIHRDMKPENILLDEDGNAYLSDFGIAKDLAAKSEHEDLMTGSPAYVSPEQITSQEVTPRTDIYSLGLVLYELLTGQQPFMAEKVATVILKQLQEPTPKLSILRPDLPPAFDAIIQRATQKDPTERYPDVLSFANAFWRAVNVSLADASDTLEFSAVPPSLHETVVITELTPVPGMTEIANPYKGLRPFEAVDVDHFFGREKLTTQLVERLEEDHPLKRFLAVVGPSGSGKSSVVKAGLIPALRQDAIPGSKDWFLVEMIPSAHPIDELENALLRVAVNKPDNLKEILHRDARGLAIAAQSILPQTGNSELALFIDQFEEAFTLAADPDETAQFLDLLASAVVDPYCPLRVVITLRADFYDRPLMHPTFSDLMSQRTHVVVPLSPSELERAITVPAEVVGVLVEPELVTQIITEVKHEPGTLPLLQYALTELFEHRQGRKIKQEEYNKIGGVFGALARRADEIYDQLTPEGKTAAKQLFLRLVTLGEGTEDTRRRVPMAELLSMGVKREVMNDVITIFGRHRLLTFDRDPLSRSPTVEVAHEAIIREWNQLKQWLDASREDVRQQRRLASLMTEWQNAKRDASFLLRGAQLQQFEYWGTNSDLALAENEQEFLQASLAAHEAQIVAERQRQQHEEELERRAQIIQRRLLIFVSVAAIIAVLLAGFAFSQRSEAERSAATAIAAEALAVEEANNVATAAAIAQRRADELQSLSLADGAESMWGQNNTDLAFTLAIEANRIPNAPVDSQRILSELIPVVAVRLFSGEHTNRVNSVSISPDGQQLLSAGSDGQLVLWNASTSEVIRQIESGNAVNGVAFVPPDATQAVSASDDGMLTLWDLETGEALRTFTGHSDAVFSVAVSPDGVHALSGSRDQTLILWDIATGDMIRRFGSENGSVGHSGRVTSVAISPDGQFGLSGASDNTAIVWNLETGEIVWELTGHTDTVSSVAFSPTLNLALTGSVDTSVMLWNLATGLMVRRFEGHTQRVTSVAFSPDGQFAASGSGSPFAGASNENTVLLWSTQSGDRLARFDGHSSQVTSVAFSSDSLNIISASADMTLRTWSIEPDVEIARLQDGQPIIDLALNEDGTRAFTADRGANLTVWDIPTSSSVRSFAALHTGAINAVAINPQGTRGLTASDDRILILWDLSSGVSLTTLIGHTNQVKDVVFSADGRFALSGSRDRTLILWDVDENSETFGQAVRTFEARHTNVINAVALNHDGTLALSASSDGTMILWDVATGTAVRTFSGHGGDVLTVAFSPDGRYAASGSVDKTIIVWEVETGAIVQRFGTESQDTTLATGHTDWVTTVAFSPDGLRVISGSRDRSVRVWDVSTGQEIQRFGAVNGRGGYQDIVTNVVVSPDGQTVLSAGLDGTIRIFPYSIEALLSWINQYRYVRPLTCDEVLQFRVGQPECRIEATETP
jgi:WD40 repeat protein/serine/threonine protein kinase